MNVAEAHAGVLDAEQRVTEAEVALTAARAQLDAALLDRGWQRLAGLTTTLIYTRNGEAISLTEALAREQELAA
jgi:hypothetical protein